MSPASYWRHSYAICFLASSDQLIHAAFNLAGKCGELLLYINKILEQCLLLFGIRVRTTPAFVRYHDNYFLRADERFDVTFYLPISPWWWLICTTMAASAVSANLVRFAPPNTSK